MSKFARMPLVPIGTHHAPQRVLEVNSSRVNHWIDSFNRIKAKGNNIPVPWGHQLKAVPAGDTEARKYTQARWNASFVERLEKNPVTGGLDVIFEPPPGWEVDNASGDLVNRTDGCRVREMSAGIGNWRDGSGEVHKDIIVHAALCTLPVVAGQKGFTTLSTEWNANLTMATDGVEYLYTLGAGTMKDDGKKDDLLDLESDLPPIPAAEPAPLAPVPAPLPTVAPDAQSAADVMALAAGVGIPLPPDTTGQNLLERLKSALHTVMAMGWKLQAPNAGQTEQETKIDTSTTGAQPESMAPSTAFMSTDTSEIVTLSAEAAEYVEAFAQERREQYAKGWDDLEASGALPKEIARQQKAHLSLVRPTVDPVTKRVSLTEGRDRLILARQASGGRTATLQALTTRVTTTPKPEDKIVTLATTNTAGAVPETVVTDKEQLTDAQRKEYMSFLISESGNLKLKEAA